MRPLSKKNQRRYYQPMDNTPLDADLMGKDEVFLWNEQDRYEQIQNGMDGVDVPVSAEIEYDAARLDNTWDFTDKTAPQNKKYFQSDLYRYQNPNYYSLSGMSYNEYLKSYILRTYLTFKGYDLNSYISSVSAFDCDLDPDYPLSIFQTIPNDELSGFAIRAYDDFIKSIGGMVSSGEGTSAYGISGYYDKDSLEKKLIIDSLRSNPDFNDDYVKKNDKIINSTETLEEFEREYQEFIESLKNNKL